MGDIGNAMKKYEWQIGIIFLDMFVIFEKKNRISWKNILIK